MNRYALVVALLLYVILPIVAFLGMLIAKAIGSAA